MPQVAGFFIGAFGGAGWLVPSALSGGVAVGASFAATAIGGLAVKLLASVALSALSTALAPKPHAAGIRSSQLLTGGTQPESFILGRYATNGTLAAPAMSHGQLGDTPNAYLNYVIEIGAGDHALAGLILDGEEVTIETTSPHADYGQRIGGRFNGFAWVKYYDGTQTVADPMLLGRGISYAILTFRFGRRIFQGWPQVRFVADGPPLYDPRQDSTAGGSGAQRWDTPATWTRTSNLAVMIYNILRGISLAGMVWGGEVPAADLPYANWAAAMAACDVAVDDGDGGTEPQYRAGFEVIASDEPMAVIEELEKAGAAAVAENGGVWRIRVGAPGLPVKFLTDDDILIDGPEDFRPFPSIEDIYNGIEASYPDPESLWESRDADPLYNATWEAEDGDRRLVAQLDMPACPYPLQVQRVMAAIIADHRRMRRHTLTLPPDFSVIEPLDVISWTSEANGYSAKSFELGEVRREILTGNVLVTLREVDPEDYDPPTGLVRPTPPDTAPSRPALQTLPGWAVAASALLDAGSTARRPAITASWTAAGVQDARGIRIAIRLDGDTGDGRELPVQDAATGSVILADGILPATDYQLRAQPVLDRETDWTAWTDVTTLDVGLTPADLGPDVYDAITEIALLAGITTVDTLPASGVLNQVIMLVPPGRLYRWNGSAWVTSVFGGIEDASLTTAAFASSIRPLEIVATLPATGNFAGRLVFLTTDGKIYRYNGGWTKAVDGADILADSIVAGKIAAGAISAAELSVGFGANWLANPDFFSGTSSWSISNSGDPVGVTTLSLRGPGTTWSGLQYPVLQVYQSTGGSTGYTDILNGPVYDDAGNLGVGYPVKPGDRIQAYVQLSTHRCTGNMWIQFLDATGTHISFVGFGSIPSSVGSSTNPDEWPVYGGFGTAPANAAYARIYLRKNATIAGQVNSYMMLHKPFLGLALANQTEFSPWDAGRATKIDGNRLVTGAVIARHMSADSVTTNALVAGAVVASKIGAGEVVAGKIAAGAIDARSLIVDGVISTRKVMDYATYAVMPTGIAGTVPASFITIGTVDFAVAPYVAIGGQYYNPGVWQLSAEIQLQFGQGTSVYFALQSQPTGGGAWTTHFTLDIYMGSSTTLFQRVTDTAAAFSATTRTYRTVAWCRAGSLPPYLRNANSLLEQVSK
jgi:hypothetical protein